MGLRLPHSSGPSEKEDGLRPTVPTIPVRQLSVTDWVKPEPSSE